VLGVFFTPGWAAVLTAGGTLGGVVVTQVVNAWNKRIDASSKREDRQHERGMAYEERVWQAKHDILTRLISACRFVKWRAAESTDENFRRGATIRALDLFRERIGGEDGISEITVYAAKPVCTALDELLNEVNVQQDKHAGPLSNLGDIGTRWDAVSKELRGAVSDGSGGRMTEILVRRADLYDQRNRALDELGAESDLDVDKVIALCDRVIDVARQDLQSRYTESGSG
jgi:hypothetical protein